MERARDYYASLPDIIRSSIPTSITKQLTTGAPTLVIIIKHFIAPKF